MKFRHCIAAIMALAGLGLVSAQAGPVSYEYTLSGVGPTGTLDFTLDTAGTFGNSAAHVTAFDIHYDGLDFTQLNGSLNQLDFFDGDLVNILYHDNLPNLTFATLGLGYAYSNHQDRRDPRGGLGLFRDGGVLDPVPEPASVALLLSGLLCAGFFFSRARAKATA